MHYKILSLRGVSSCLVMVNRIKNTKIIMACVLVIVYSILFRRMSIIIEYAHHIFRENKLDSEVDHDHEYHCLVNDLSPFAKLKGSELFHARNNLDKPFGNKPSIKQWHGHTLRGFTLKPNFLRLINASQLITTINASYILENPALCSSVNALTILIIVHSSIDHTDRRLAIRNTWANNRFYRHHGNVRTLFLLGKHTNQTSTIQTTIENEFKRFGDILQGDFIDDYHNLTLKGVMAYKWLTERCRNAHLILKVDDDITVNMFKLFIDYLHKYKSEKMSIICNHIFSHTMGIIRYNNSKWYVNNNHFRGLRTYPTEYCSGFFVVFTNDLIPALYSSSTVTPFFWVDDVYLYGLVPGNVPGVKYISLKRKWHQLAEQVALKCYINESATCSFLVTGARSAQRKQEIWAQMVKRYVQGKDFADLSQY